MAERETVALKPFDIEVDGKVGSGRSGWSYIVLSAVTGQYSWKSIEYPPDANFPRVLSRRIRT